MKPHEEIKSVSAGCYDCGMKYPFGLDMILPDKQWNWIFPEGNGGGLLCPNCIAIRAEKVGASTVILCWIDRIDWAVARPKKWLKPPKIFTYKKNRKHWNHGNSV